jgi:DinB family protein
MNPIWRTAIWQQYGAAIDMLDNAIVACPEDVWIDGSQKPQFQFWYIAFHTLFFLDLYLSGTADGFKPPAPFTLSEMDPAGVYPEPYTKDELRRYLVHCRAKCRARVESMTDEHGAQMCHFDWLDLSAADLLLYDMRHVQHHTAQLNLILRQRTDSAPKWVRVAR